MTPGMMASHKQGGGITYRQPFCPSRQARPCRAPRDAHAHPGSALLAQQWTPSLCRVVGTGTPIPSVPYHPTTQTGFPTPRLLAVAGLHPQAVEGMWGSSTSLAPTQPGPTLTAPPTRNQTSPRSQFYLKTRITGIMVCHQPAPPKSHTSVSNRNNGACV